MDFDANCWFSEERWAPNTNCSEECCVPVFTPGFSEEGCRHSSEKWPRQPDSSEKVVLTTRVFRNNGLDSLILQKKLCYQPDSSEQKVLTTRPQSTAANKQTNKEITHEK